MFKQGNWEFRHIYLDVPHSANVKPSWYGESVGHCEGDTLVVDTIGQNLKTFVDAFRTPHSENLHVVERWRLIDGGKTLEVKITVDDPDAFNAALVDLCAPRARAVSDGRRHLRREQPEPLRLQDAGRGDAGFLESILRRVEPAR